MPIPLRPIPGTDVSLCAVGFGCVRLTACKTEADAIRTLEAALESGITHFDTARLYGGGYSEVILGKFLAGRRDRVTVATKLGLMPAPNMAKRRGLTVLAKRLLRPFPFLMRMAAKQVSKGGRSGAFDVDSARQSFEASLAALAVDHVDVLLLHEATLADAGSEPLQKYLEDQVRRGTVRSLGLSSHAEAFEGDAARVPAMFPVLQLDHSAAAPNLANVANRQNRLPVVFSIFGPMPALKAAAGKLPRALGEAVGADLTSPRVLSSLMLHYAMHSNPGGALLFSSMSPANIAANAADAQASPFSPQQLEAFGVYARAAAALPA